MKPFFWTLLTCITLPFALAQELVREEQEEPIGNECPTYRVHPTFDVALTLQFRHIPISRVHILKNGEILINNRIEDHVPRRNPPLKAQVLYRYGSDGSPLQAYPFVTKSTQQMDLGFTFLTTSKDESKAISIAYLTTHLKPVPKEEMVVIITDLKNGESRIAYSIPVDDLRIVQAKMDSAGNLTVVHDDESAVLIAPDGTQSPATNIYEQVQSIPEVRPLDFTGPKAGPISYTTGNQTYVSAQFKLDFYEWGQSLGQVELGGCKLIKLIPLNARATYVVCEEGIRRYELDLGSQKPALKRSFVGYKICK